MGSLKMVRLISNYFTKLFARVAYVIGVVFIIAFLLMVRLFFPIVYVITGIKLRGKTFGIPNMYDKWFNKKFGIKTLIY